MNYKENMDAGRFANFKSVSATFSLLNGDRKNPFSNIDFTKFGSLWMIFILICKKVYKEILKYV